MVKDSTKNALRLQMRLKLFRDGKVVHSASRWKKSTLRLFLTGIASEEWDSGELEVWYSRPKGFWNKGYFKNLAEFNELLTTLTEWDLVKDFA